MCIHATHRTERQYEASSRAAAAAVDAVARREWEHPAADSAVADSPQSAERELRAARREQQAAAEPAGPAAATEGGSSDDGGSSSSSGVSSSAEPPGSGIVKVVGLFPFLTVDPDCSHQRSLRRLTRHHGALARLAGCLGWLPLGARRALVRWASPNLEPHAVDVSAQSEGFAGQGRSCCCPYRAIQPAAACPGCNSRGALRQQLNCHRMPPTCPPTHPASPSLGSLHQPRLRRERAVHGPHRV